MKEGRLIDRKAASRIQSSTCKANDGKTPKDSFAARAMSAAYKNEPITTPSKVGFFDKRERRTNNDDKLMLAIGVGALALGTGLAMYYSRKDPSTANNRVASSESFFKNPQFLWGAGLVFILAALTFLMYVYHIFNTDNQAELSKGNISHLTL